MNTQTQKLNNSERASSGVRKIQAHLEELEVTLVRRVSVPQDESPDRDLLRTAALRAQILLVRSVLDEIRGVGDTEQNTDGAE